MVVLLNVAAHLTVHITSDLEDWEFSLVGKGMDSLAQWTSRELADRAWSPLVGYTLHEANLCTSGYSGVSFSLFPDVWYYYHL